MDQVIFDKLILDLKSLGHLTPDGEKISSVKGAYDTIVNAIQQVEAIKTDAGAALAGSDKKQLVIAVVNYFVDIPWVPRWLENDLLSWGIDLVITFLNQKLGQNWSVMIH